LKLEFAIGFAEMANGFYKAGASRRCEERKILG
jgi:hypothetical protein